MSLALWPFLVGRTRTAGHREVVVPALLADTPFGRAIALAAGAEETPDGHAVLREIRGPRSGPLCMVFRVFQPRQSDFDLGGDQPLLDGSGRPIVMSEGFFVERSARQCVAAQFGRDDLADAHAAVIPAYQRFWRDEDSYSVILSQPITVAGRGEPLLLDRVRAWESSTALPRSPQQQGRRRLPRKAVTALAGTALIAAGVGYCLNRPPPTGRLRPHLTDCLGVTHSRHLAGLTAAERRRPPGTATAVCVVRFGSRAAYENALGSIHAARSDTAPGCPPADQVRYCWRPGHGLPTYLWTAPADRCIATATAPTFTRLEAWWREGGDHEGRLC
jgi:hypothetical protein